MRGIHSSAFSVFALLHITLIKLLIRSHRGIYTWRIFLKNLLKYLKGYVKESILGPLFKLFEATLELIVPLVIALIIDNGISRGEAGRSYVIWQSLLLQRLQRQ